MAFAKPTPFYMHAPPPPPPPLYFMTSSLWVGTQEKQSPSQYIVGFQTEVKIKSKTEKIICTRNTKSHCDFQ